ncbi:zf-HC2 domain-containing protein [Lysinibacillus sp. NPDC048646]|uniref:zf-HC2 domain-containing protein n=1 Tax=Lysinibacillus sp. NPDC048646 TaxID=3390574 RepID=UPI003D049970
MSQECSIVEDLLPLYKKQALQADTVNFIEQHVACCEHCQQLTYAQPLPKPTILPFKQTLSFFHVIFIVLSFMFALNSSLLGNHLGFVVSYALFGCLTYLFYKNSWIVFIISFIPVFVWAIVDNVMSPLYIAKTSLSDIGTLLLGATFIAILHTIFALLGSALAIILRKFFR